MENIKDYIEVPVYYTESRLDWEELIKDKFGPLFGYFSTLTKDGIDKVLKDLFVDQIFESENGKENNFSSISSLYINYIENQKPQNVEENQQEIDAYNIDIEKVKNSDISVLKKYGVIAGVYIKIPYSKTTKDYAVIMGEDSYIFPEQNSLYNKYRTEEELANTYVPDDSYLIEKKHSEKVYIFSRTRGQLVDVTKNLNQISINVSATGGNFSLSYNLSELDSEQIYPDSNQFCSDTPITGLWYSRATYIQSIFRENDLVFIKFENLEVEKGSSQKIVGKAWDMIGLIDTTSINSSPVSLAISIEGRDLSKLLIEDQNIFIPYQFASSQKTTFGGASSKIFKRLFATGEYKLQFLYSMRSIETTMGFIFNHLTNMEILSLDGKFFLNREYGDRLSKQFSFDQSGKIEGKESILGIWGIIKFGVDEKIRHYRIADSSISSPDGSIMSQLQKIAQAPFVELQYDTFGDMYNIIARRPPWDKESIKNANCVSIWSINSIADNLSMDTEVYSLFQISPQGALFGGNNSLPLAYIPMVVLDKYVEIWGNRLYNAVTNYIDFNTYLRVVNDNTRKNPKIGFIDDLCWLLEVMAYKPFTRRGVITIKGDRRIKRGMWIYYSKTNEIFYVDAVQNSVSIDDRQTDRLTTLQVSRGMVLGFTEKVGVSDKFLPEEFITGESIIDKQEQGDNQSNMTKREFASYFDLIDLNFLKESLKRNLVDITNNYTLFKAIAREDHWESTESIVNEGVFDFFRKGLQFGYSFESREDTEDVSNNDNSISIIKDINNQTPLVKIDGRNK